MPHGLGPVLPRQLGGPGMDLDLVWGVPLASVPAEVGPLGDLHFPVPVVVLLRNVVRPVWSPEVVPHEKRLSAGPKAIDQIDGVISQEVGHRRLDRTGQRPIHDAVAAGLPGGAIILPHLVDPTVVREILPVLGVPEAPSSVTGEVLALESHVPRERWLSRGPEHLPRRCSQVPLARVPAPVSGRLQPARQQIGPVRELVHGAAQVVDVGADPMLVGIQPGHDRGPGRAADRARGVGGLEPMPLPRQAVDVRGLARGLPITAHGREPVLIREYQQDIGLLGFRHLALRY